MPVIFETSDCELTALLQGEIDHHTAAELREEIDRAVDILKPEVLVLDFSRVGFMDSSGIGLIMGRFQNVRSYGGSLRVANPPPTVARMMRLAGMGRLGVL
ncbi:MAG: anti-sigma factor antagonist [Clostridia bacterium]|nr:anti-sigma factor antagonist [Clostridia bacterium]MBQ1554814.1 anti-sigma factor antagonist [Clostridia bacterium]MBQ4396935.1 anti-sigma factor antagonist [Clostridia bacterium]